MVQISIINKFNIKFFIKCKFYIVSVKVQLKCKQLLQILMYIAVNVNS